jgi:hypothetical protein
MTYYVYYTDDTVGHVLKEFNCEYDAREYTEELKKSREDLSFKIIKGFEITDDEYV